MTRPLGTASRLTVSRCIRGERAGNRRLQARQIEQRAGSETHRVGDHRPGAGFPLDLLIAVGERPRANSGFSDPGR